MAYYYVLLRIINIKSVELTIWELPALQTLVTVMNRVAHLQNSIDMDVSLSLYGRADLQWIGY